MSFLLDNCTLKPFNEELAASCDRFTCGNIDLDNFFYEESFSYNNKLIGKTHCFTLDNNPSIIVGIFTLLNDSIKTKFLPNSRAKKIKRNMPREKHLKSYPAVLIGRLGININLKGLGIGSDLMDFIKHWFVAEDNKTGCRYLLVDAYNNPQVINYYQKNEFSFMFSNEEQEKIYLGQSLDEELDIRFMYFDLIVLNEQLPEHTPARSRTL